AEMRSAAETLARRGMPEAQQSEDLDRFRQTTDGPRAKRYGLNELPRRRLGIGCQENLTGRRDLFHAGSEMRRGARDVVGQMEAVLDRLDDDRAGMNPNPDLEGFIAELVHRRLHGERRGTRALRMILMRTRRAKERHDAIAAHLVDHTVVVIDD